MMAYRIGDHFSVIAVLFWITVTVGKQYGLHVQPRPYWANYTERFTCDGLDEANASHALSRRSWLLTAGNEDKQINYNTTDHGSNLDLYLTPAMNGARLTCRAHARTPRHQVMLAPPLTIRLYDKPTLKQVSIRMVKVQIGDVIYSEEGTLKRRAGDEVDITCFAANLGQNISLYMYILIQNGDVETEKSGAQISDIRLGNVSNRFTVRAEDNNSMIYCLARWFYHNDTNYENPSAVRSAPVTLLIETISPEPENDEDSLFLWIAVGVGAVGWLVAVILIGMLVYMRKRRNANTPRNTTQVPQEATNYSYAECASSSTTSSTQGATVLPMHAVRSLAAANMKLTQLAPSAPPSAPPPPPPAGEGATYCNVQELNSLLRRKQF